MTSAERKPYRELASVSCSQERERLGIEMPKEAVAVSAAESTGRKRKRQTKPKDPNAPKRPTTAFFFFAQDERSKVRDAHPEFKVTEISKELGRMWKELASESKEKYEQLAKADKDRYTEENKAYQIKKSRQSDSPAEYDEEDTDGDAEA